MPLDRRNLQSIAYWDDNHQPQRFYVGFCLLMSGIQDALLGRKEQEEKNLNWAATCSYFSLVHTGRLLVFLAIGDYPTEHRELRELIQGSRGKGDKNKWWLNNFVQDATLIASSLSVQAGACDRSDLIKCLDDYLARIGVSHSSERRVRFSKILNAASRLRTESNYEALLIANEYNHFQMSSAFEELAKCFTEATSFAIQFALDAFDRFVHVDEALSQEREAYCGYLLHYLNSHLQPAVQRKLSGLPEVEMKLEEIVANITPPRWDSHFTHLENVASWDNFAGKRGLMERFRKDIEALDQALGQGRPADG